MDSPITSALSEISSDPKAYEDAASYNLGNPSRTAASMTYETYDDIFPVLPDTAINPRADGMIGKWNNKLRVGPRNVTQVIFLYYSIKIYLSNCFVWQTGFPHPSRRKTC